MCKFCDSKKEKRVLSYDNHDSMNIYCGQYQGVSVSADISMKGNMLILAGHGSYRSRSDCYYEDEGLDCDSEGAENSPEEYIKIEYCPFCGKKIESTEYEKRKTNDELQLLKYKLKKTEEKIDRLGLHVSFTFVAKGDKYEKARNMVWKDFEADCKLIPITLETILKEFGNLKAHIRYGTMDSYGYSTVDYKSCPKFNPKEGVKFNGSGFGEFHGYTYSITNEQYEMLISMGLVKGNKTKLNKMVEKRIKLKEDVEKMKKRIKILEVELKKYKNGK